MRLRPTGSVNLTRSSHGGDGQQTRQEVPECQDGDGHDEDEDKKSLSKANKHKEEDKAATVPPARCTLAAPSPPPTNAKEMEEMFIRLVFSQAVILKLVDDQGIDSPQTLGSLSDEDIFIICKIIQWPGDLASSGKVPDRGESDLCPGQKISNLWHSCSK